MFGAESKLRMKTQRGRLDLSTGVSNGATVITINYINEFAGGSGRVWKVLLELLPKPSPDRAQAS